MIYAVRKLVEADFTVAAINAQIATLNTLYSLSVPNVASVNDGAQKVVGNMQDAAFPALLHYVGTQPTNGEMASFGKRDIPDFPVIFALTPDAITTCLTVAPSFRFKLQPGVRYLINPG